MGSCWRCLLAASQLQFQETLGWDMLDVLSDRPHPEIVNYSRAFETCIGLVGAVSSLPGKLFPPWGQGENQHHHLPLECRGYFQRTVFMMHHQLCYHHPLQRSHEFQKGYGELQV